MRIYFTRFTFIVFFVLLLSASHGQKMISQRSIQWTGTEQISLTKDIAATILTFNGSVMSQEMGFLPVYHEQFEIAAPDLRINVSLSDEIYNSVPASELTSIEDINLVTDQFGINTDIIFIRKIPHASIEVLPIRYNQETGYFEKLLSFKLNITFEPIENHIPQSTRDYATESVLATGDWYKLITRNTGVHTITNDDLVQMGVDVHSLDPRNIRIYGNGNGMLPEANAEDRTDDLLENAIYVYGENDGQFDADDYILFYGFEQAVWRYNIFSGLFEHQVNYYSDDVVYFLTVDLGPGKRIEQEAPVQDDHTHFVTSFTDYAYHEAEDRNILKTGKYWYGEEFKSQLVYNFPFDFPNIDVSSRVSLRTNIAARSTEHSYFHYSVNGNNILSAFVNKVNALSTVYAWSTTPDSVGFYPSNDLIDLEVEYERTSSIAQGWMNYIELNARRHLIFEDGQLLFRDHLSYGHGMVARFEVSNTPQENLMLWDVTEFFNIKSIPFDISGGNLNFKVDAEILREFLLFDQSDYYPVEIAGSIENQNLHGLDPKELVIVSHPLFLEEANRIALLHAQNDNLSSLILTPDQIYNEFSSGKQDVAAIRDFCKMLYDKADSSNIPRYLLLFGDGSYDPKDRNGELANFIPAFQSKESLKLGYSFVTDDFYGQYDPDEGNNAYAKSLDIGIGRFPVSSVEQARSVVDKIENYMSKSDSVMGDWRNKICFVADDEDQNTHFKQAEELAGIFDTARVYNLNKVYLDAYPQVSTSSGHRYPKVNEAINDVLNDGLLIFNYTGHGGEYGLAHEKVLDIGMINSWTNINSLPLFIAATCEFSRFDDPKITSAGEWVLLNPKGGSIGLYTTTRLAWSDPNFKLNKIIYENAFKIIDGEYPRLGDLMRIAKTKMHSSQNVKNIVLLGDPALQLVYPRHWVETDSIVKRDLTKQNDTMQAMSGITVYGSLTNIYGTPLDDFNGLLYPTVFDKEVRNKTLGNDPGSYPAYFNLQSSVLYKGVCSIKEGKFEFSFVVPKDIAYNYGFGKISYYAYDTLTFEDAQGYENVLVGGMDDDAVMDYEGPEISLFMNSTDFVSGGYTDDSPVLMAFFKDDQGINSFGNGIGHNIVMYLDDQTSQPIYLDDLYTPDIDDFQNGTAIYPFSNLADGLHTLHVKAWDVYNNPSEAEISFYVNVDGQLKLEQAFNYPNPFSTSTTFQFYHNKPGNVFDININIYNVVGQLVSSISGSSSSDNEMVTSIEWDGRSNSGDLLGSGVYVYTMRVTDQQGTHRQVAQRLIISR